MSTQCLSQEVASEGTDAGKEAKAKAWSILRLCCRGKKSATDPEVVEAARVVGESKAIVLLTDYFRRYSKEPQPTRIIYPTSCQGTDASFRRVKGCFGSGR
ncbi:MAG: hypothetical protein WCW87_02280 [Candidatus Paceibacterota bacterium]